MWQIYVKAGVYVHDHNKFGLYLSSCPLWEEIPAQPLACPKMCFWSDLWWSQSMGKPGTFVVISPLFVSLSCCHSQAISVQNIFFKLPSSQSGKGYHWKSWTKFNSIFNIWLVYIYHLQNDFLNCKDTNFEIIMLNWKPPDSVIHKSLRLLSHLCVVKITADYHYHFFFFQKWSFIFHISLWTFDFIFQNDFFIFLFQIWWLIFYFSFHNLKTDLSESKNEKSSMYPFLNFFHDNLRQAWQFDTGLTIWHMPDCLSAWRLGKWFLIFIFSSHFSEILNFSWQLDNLTAWQFWQPDDFDCLTIWKLECLTAWKLECLTAWLSDSSW